MGTAPAPPTTNADFKGFGEARSGLSPIFHSLLPPISAPPIHSKISTLPKGNWLAVPFFRVNLNAHHPSN